jgi:hypothetical protein
VLLERKQQVAPRWLNRASWLALVLLTWTQLAFAGHQFEHSAAYADSCDACVQLDRLDDIIGERPAALELLRPAGGEVISASPAPVSTAFVPAFNPRAPPVI